MPGARELHGWMAVAYSSRELCGSDRLAVGWISPVRALSPYPSAVADRPVALQSADEHFAPTRCPSMTCKKGGSASNPWLDMAQWLAECSGAWKPQPGIGHTRAGSGSTSQRVNSSGCMRVDRLWCLWGAVCILGCAIGWTAGKSKQVRTTRCSPPSCVYFISSAPHTGKFLLARTLNCVLGHEPKPVQDMEDLVGVWSRGFWTGVQEWGWVQSRHRAVSLCKHHTLHCLRSLLCSSGVLCMAYCTLELSS